MLSQHETGAPPQGGDWRAMKGLAEAKRGSTKTRLARKNSILKEWSSEVLYRRGRQDVCCVVGIFGLFMLFRFQVVPQL
jgi:hypothetical protein